MFDLHLPLWRVLVFYGYGVFHQICRKIRGLPERQEEDVRNKVVVITGAIMG